MDGLGEIGASVQRALLERAGRVTARLQERRGLESDLLESDDEYLVVFDAPGAVSTDVQVRYVEGSVRVRMDRFRDYREGFEMRFPGRGLSLDGRVGLPEDAVVDPDAADATLVDNGTLEVVLPKREDAAVRDDDEPVGVEIDGADDGEDDETGDDADHDDDHDAAADGDHDTTDDADG
ncbi:molecular chaperone Hsp20 [Halobacteriales archaeon SW_7_71_33]|nr:MAG: molecular chaperone Hsp20 [Halobacteriales archaeon SW_7_71_33]